MTTTDPASDRADAGPDTPDTPGVEAVGDAARWGTGARRAAVAGGAVLAVVAAQLLGLDMLQVLVAGLQSGSVYALVALGLVLVYKATTVLNFAQGALGSAAAFLMFSLLAGLDPSVERLGEVGPAALLGAAAVAVLGGAALAVVLNLTVVRRLADSSAVTALVATIGITTLLIALELVVFAAQRRPFPRFVDGTPCLASSGGECTAYLSLGGVRILWNVILVVLVLAVAAALLAALFRTPPGIALLATAQEPYAAELHGVSVRAMSTLAWGIAGGLAAVAGILGAGVFEGITPGFMTASYLIPAFTGAVLGGLTSMVGAVVGGLLLGVGVAFANELWLHLGLSTLIPGPPQVMTFVLLLGVLLVRPHGLLGRRT